MADFNVNKSDTTHLSEDAGNNLVPNSGFENAPSFTAATSTSGRWIDGTAGGSTTNDTFAWAITTIAGTASAQFDTSTSHSGSESLKLSTSAISSQILVRLTTSTSVANINRYNIPVHASTAYILTYWMSTNLTSGTSNDGAYIGTLEYSSTSATSLASANGTKVKTTTGWTQYSLNFTTTSTTEFVNINIQNTGNTGTATLILDAWFDDINLQTVTPNGTVNIPVSAIVTPGIQNVSGPKIWS